MLRFSVPILISSCFILLPLGSLSAQVDTTQGRRTVESSRDRPANKAGSNIVKANPIKPKIKRADPRAGLKPSGGAKSVNMSVDSVKVDAALNNLFLTLTQAQVVPHIKNGKSVGLRLFAVQNGSIFSEIGLKNNDILKTINGNSLADMNQAIRLFAELRGERFLSLKLERARKDLTYNYDIK